MISIRKYLDGAATPSENSAAPPRAGRNPGNERDLLHVVLKAYNSALAGIARSSIDACPAEGPALEAKLDGIARAVSEQPNVESIARADAGVQAELRDWGHRAARHYRAKAGEVKELLLAMARTTESVGLRDAHYTQQIGEITCNLNRIASLDDISEIRSSIHRSAAELKDSLNRMTAEGHAVLERMQAQVTNFQTKLEQAEQLASIDALTRLRSRTWVEGQLEQRIAASAPFSVAILDIDDFKSVNDRYGHIAGDMLLKQFADELRSSCRATDIVARWGGDEFLILLDAERTQAEAQLERVSTWVCGQYTVQTSAGAVKFDMEVSIGLAQWEPPQTLPQLLERADAAMYERKAAGKQGRVSAR